MKKKLLALLMLVTMVAAMFAGCGGSDDAVSDETFAALQSNYAGVVEAYNAVLNLYTSDEIAADASIEDNMNKAADVINQMGEITRDTITEADADSLNSAMIDILDALSLLVDGMQAN